MRKFFSVVLMCAVALSLITIPAKAAYTAVTNGTATAKIDMTYMLPDTSSPKVFNTAFVSSGDKLQVFCKDGNFYLILVPFNHNGTNTTNEKFFIGYADASRIKASGIPDASSFYKNQNATVNSDAVLYHQPSKKELKGATANVTVRGRLTKGSSVTILFEKDGFYFVRSGSLTGFMEKSKVSIQTAPTPTVTPTPVITPSPGTSKPGSFNISIDKPAFNTDETITLKWSTSQNAASYGLTVSKEPYGYQNAVIDRDNLTGNIINIGKLPAGKYRFQMVARNKYGESPYTSLVYFSVNNTSAPTPSAVKFDPVWPAPDAFKVTVLSYYYGSYAGKSHPTEGSGSVKGAMDIGGGGNIVAVESGTVVKVVKGKGGGWGNNVTIKHDDGKYSFYAHMKDNSITVSKNSKVKKGQKIGVMGETGISEGIHLHFEIWDSKGNTTETWMYFREKYKSKIIYDTDIVTGGANPKAWRDWITQNCKRKIRGYVGK